MRRHPLAVLRPDTDAPPEREAIDAERRNCYLNASGLQPFDVILCVPDESLERYLGIYPR